MPSSSRIDWVAERSALIREVLPVAHGAHAGQLRETGSGEIPFIDHPLAVAELLVEHGHPDEVLAVGLLHDVLEHSEMDAGELRERFGESIAALVETLTEDAAIESYEDRKEEHRKRLAVASPEARAVFSADKIANVIVLREAYEIEREDVDVRLPVSLDRKILVWEFDLEMLFEHSPGLELTDRLATELLGLWGQRAEEEAAFLP